jgi:hypothetical protein
MARGMRLSISISKKESSIYMKIYSLLAALVLLPFTTQASPLQYQISFGANIDDPDGGVGSFYWDSDLHSISGLTWNFGDGLTGGVDDSVGVWSQLLPPSIGGTISELFFEIVMQQDVHPLGCTSPTQGCGQGFSAYNGMYGSYPAIDINFVDEAVGAGGLYYYLRVSANKWIAGTFTTRFIGTSPPTPPVSVPEPPGIAIIVLGLIGLLLQIYRIKKETLSWSRAG